MPIAVLAEVCEERVLLTGDAVTDPADFANTPADYYTTGHYSDDAASGPLGDEYSGISDEYSEYESVYEQGVGDAYSDADEQSEDGQSENDAVDCGFTNNLQGLLGDLLTDLGATSSDDDEQNGDAAVSPFAVPEYVELQSSQLPLLQIDEDFSAAAPQGTDTFSNTSDTQETISADAAGNVIPETLLTRTSIDEQLWTSSDEWQLTQAATNTFETPQTVDSDGGTLPALTGAETHSVTVVNGTETIETHTITNRLRIAEGHDAADTSDDVFQIPTAWLTRTASDGPLTSSTEQQNSGTAYTLANTGLQTEVTTTQVELDDGTPATQKAVSISWYIEFSWRTSGNIGDNGQNSSDAGNGASLPDGATAQLGIGYEIYASAPIGGHFTVTTVTASGDVLPTRTDTSWGFAVAAMAGGTITTTYSVNHDESSGNSEDGNDTYSFIDTTDTYTVGGSAGFDFWIAGSTAEEESTADHTVGFWPGSKHLDQPTRENPKSGEASAQELLSEHRRGLQFTSSLQGGYNHSKDYNYRERTRDAQEESVTTTTLRDLGSSHSEGQVRVAAGTEEIVFSVSGTGQETVNEVSTYLSVDGGDNGQEEGDTLVFHDIEEYSNQSSSGWNWQLSLGGETQYQRDAEGEYDIDITLVTDNQVIHNGVSAGYRYEHEYRDYSDVDVLELAEGEAPPEKVDRLVEFFTGSEPNVIHDRVPGGELPGQESRSVEDIVADYRAAKEQQLRLQALAEMITDPELANYVAGQAALLGEIVGVITEEATTAGITQGELSAIDQELAQNVADNPPEVPEQWDGGEWGVSAITAGVFIGAAQGSAAAIDGAIPFYDPFEDLGYYNGENETLQWSQTLGGVSRNLLLAAGGTWAWNVSGGGQFSVIFTNGASRLAGVPLPHVSFAYGNTTNGMVLAEAMGMGGGDL